jgi:acyl carrier protein
MSETKQQIRNFIVGNFLFGEAGNLTDESSFLGQGIIDSTGVLELASHLESTYGIKVRDEELVPENLDSINAVSAYIQKKLTSPK